MISEEEALVLELPISARPCHCSQVGVIHTYRSIDDHSVISDFLPQRINIVE